MPARASTDIPGATETTRPPPVAPRPVVCLALAAALLLAPPAALAQATPPEGPPPVAPDATLTPAGGTFLARLTTARAAFDAGQFDQAAAGFSSLRQDFGQNPEAATALTAHLPLHALALVRSGALEAALPVIDAALATKETTAPARDLLAYYQAIAMFELQRWPEARAKLLAYFENPANDRKRRLEALLAAGTTYQKENDHAGAAAFFAKSADRIRQAEPAAAARATLISLQSLLAANNLDAALAAVRLGYQDIASQPQLITFQFLTLDLGNRFLEQKRWLDAIVCFQRVWSRDRLLRHQGDRLAQWKRECAVAAARPDAILTLPRLDGMATAAEAEIAALTQNTGFDAAVRYRLANAFLQLHRPAEAATILEDMLRALPPDPVVEQSALALMQCWLQAKRWEKAVECAALYEEKFGGKPGSTHHPDILLLMAVAQESDARYTGAAATCAALASRFPDSPAAATAGFKQGFLLLMADQYADGLAVLRAYPAKFPRSPLREDAAYWEGEALAMLGNHEESRACLATYLDGVAKKSWRGDYADGATFRRAYCLFAMAKYEAAHAEFATFLADFPGSEYAAEAHLLAGDALCGIGRIDDGLASYARILPDAGRFHEEGIFKTGKALRLTGDTTGLRAHFARFLESSPKSSRAAEAVHWISWSWRQAGDESKARETAWDAVNALGGDPDQAAVEDILDALAKMHRRDTESGSQFMLRLQHVIDRQAAEVPDGPDILACRAHWARARFVQVTQPTLFRTEMLAAHRRLTPKDHPPRLSVDIAAAHEELGLDRPAEELLAEVRKWHPRTLEKARIFSTIGRLAAKRGDTKAALAAYERFDREAISPPARLRGEVMLARARLHLAAGEKSRALAGFKDVQSDRALPARLRAEAFFDAGAALAPADPQQAAPFYERVYVAYAGFSDLAAKSYLARANCLERLGHPDKAREVYTELTTRDDLAAETAAVEAARRKLEAMP